MADEENHSLFIPLVQERPQHWLQISENLLISSCLHFNSKTILWPTTFHPGCTRSLQEGISSECLLPVKVIASQPKHLHTHLKGSFLHVHSIHAYLARLTEAGAIPWTDKKPDMKGD